MDKTVDYQESFTRNLGVIHEQEQATLLAGRVTVVGAGGVGGITLIQLARMGVGHVHVIDQDVFEPSNLNRQMLSSISRLHQKKAQCAKETLLDINPNMKIKVSEVFITEENAHELLRQTDVIVDATDNLVARVIIHRTARELGIPSVWIAVSPPFRGAVMSLTPDSMPYEQVSQHPSFGKPLTDELKEQIHALKDGRAEQAVSFGADPAWAKAFVDKKRPWAVLSPVANMVGIMASFEAFKFLINRIDLPPIVGPKLIRMNLADPKMVSVENPPNGTWDNTLL